MIKETPLPTEETETTCSYCSVGCSLKLESYGDMLIKANPDKEGSCEQGPDLQARVNGASTAP